MRKTFTFNGRNSSEFGLFITGAAVHDGAAYDYEFVEVPGRNGDLILDNGRFHNLEVRYPAFVVDPAQMPAIRAWLLSPRGYCELTDEYNPAEYRMACFAYSLQADPFAQSAVNFDLVFNCKPQRFSYEGTDEYGHIIPAQLNSQWAGFYRTPIMDPSYGSTVRLKPVGDVSAIESTACQFVGITTAPTLPSDAATKWRAGEYVTITDEGDPYYMLLSTAYEWSIKTDMITGTEETYAVKAAEPVANLTPYTAMPLFVVRGVNSGSSSGGSYALQFAVNGVRVRVARSYITAHSGLPLYIDSDTQDCFYVDSNGDRQNANSYVSIVDETTDTLTTEFPKLEPGENTIHWEYESDLYYVPLCAVGYVPRWYTI